MTSQKEFLNSVVEKLQQAGIDYVICGSVAASFYGVERSTQDADIIINPTEEQLMNFVKLLGDAYYVSSQTALDALKQRTVFNLIDMENAWKADLDYGRYGSRHATVLGPVSRNGDRPDSREQRLLFPWR